MSETMTHSAAAEVADRQRRMLRTALGPDIGAALADPKVIEIMVNPDGKLWLERLGERRMVSTGVKFSAAEADRILRVIAAHARIEVDARYPNLSAELPTGERFQGMLPPVVSAAAFCLRKRAIQVFGLERYLEDGILTAAQVETLRQAVRERLNILIAGGTSTGKTTLANALLKEIKETDDRLVMLEDIPELQCTARNYVSMCVKPGIVTMTELVRATLRMRIDRIVLGGSTRPRSVGSLEGLGHGTPGWYCDRACRLCPWRAYPSRTINPRSGDLGPPGPSLPKPST